MTDVTAQAFREAAEAERQKSHGIGLTYVVELLLAAAEQREQWDKCRDGNVTLGRIMDVQHEQIATLTAERDEARATIEQALTFLSDPPETEDRAYNEGWMDAGMTVTGILSKGGQ
jgi:hypothetical protein